MLIGPGASEAPGRPRVAIDTGRAGVHEGGTAYRMDDVPVHLTPALSGSRTAALVLGALFALVAAGLRVTTTSAFAARWLLPRLPVWRSAHPDISLDIISTYDVLDLAAGEAGDVGVTRVALVDEAAADRAMADAAIAKFSVGDEFGERLAEDPRVVEPLLHVGAVGLLAPCRAGVQEPAE